MKCWWGVVSFIKVSDCVSPAVTDRISCASFTSVYKVVTAVLSLGYLFLNTHTLQLGLSELLTVSPVILFS